MEASTRSTSGSSRTTASKLAQAFLHRLERRLLIALDLAGHAARVLLREEALGNDHVQVNRQPDGGQGHHQGDAADGAARRRASDHRRAG